ncbi:hypothetical protein XAP412_1020004 [Xanthomonas phaseoli pv. phaseoli]|uniref:Uncharacterized protein n=1 Tax=Xanthomonas campestris pv. phaseoli TaxID=317013 RepID=A0ABY1TL26_XANCH|nr:hypothetical protein XAP412_1020004 [Xanthomonas phaseoli pv. phaseoli]SON75818.1 hypothetical protein XAP6984_1070004 [Xanthomonas phaseoli pv. phaseoli]SOO30432.1 hypothetical protein XAP6164_4330043 [Xanthomonas phaseoli pv. phaseoli]
MQIPAGHQSRPRVLPNSPCVLCCEAGGIRVLPTLRPTGLAQSPQDSCSVPNLKRDEVVGEPMEAPFYLATSFFHKRERILRVILHLCWLNPDIAIAPFEGRQGFV